MKSIASQKARTQRLKAGAKLLSERTKYIKETEKKEKRLTKEKEKKQKAWQQLKKKLSKPVQSKRVLKQSQATVRIPEREKTNIFNDPNRFFKEEQEDAEMALFFK